MNSGISKTSDPVRLLLNFINLKRSDKYVPLSNLSIYYIWKNTKKDIKNNKFLILKKKMKLLGSTKSKITKDENGENVPHLEITEVVFLHCNIDKNNYQQDSRILYAFAPNKSFGKSLDISPKNFIFLKTFNSISKIQESCIHFFVINPLVNY